MKLKIINSQTNEELQEFDLASAIRNNGKCIVGRSATSGLFLESSDISRSHGEFSYKSGEYYFTDMGSSNGSLINNQVATKNRPYLLKAGDVIHLGDFLLIPQPITGVYEDATVIAPIAFAPSSGSKLSVSEASSSPEIISEITPAQSTDEAPPKEFPAAMAAEPENMEQSDRDDIPSEESDEDIPAKVTDDEEASTPSEVAAENGTPEISDAIVTESNREDILADVSLEQPHEDIPAQAMDDSTTLQESKSPEAMAESDTAEAMKEDAAETMAESDNADIPAVINEKPDSKEESHTDTALEEEFDEEIAAAVAEESIPVEVAQASTVEESAEPSTPAASTPTENVEAEAALTENTYIQTDLPECISMESTDAMVSPTSEATDEELSDRDDLSVVPEILKEKYIVLLAHDSKKAELVDFIECHQATFSKCLFMAPSAISEALIQHDIAVSRKLPNLTAGGYQEVNSAIASKNLLGVIFLRDFFVQQSTQANDEALSRACNVNQIVLATNLATAQAFEGYLQHLIASTPKISLAEGSGQ